MLTSADHLFLEIFHEVYSFEGDPKYSAGDYLKRYKTEITAMGRALECLDVAHQNERCGLGWKPTPYLLTIVAKRAARPLKEGKEIITKADRAILDLIVDAATAGSTDLVYRGNVYDFVTSALRAIGLARYDAEGEEKPTRLLRTLFWDAYMERRWKAEAESRERLKGS